MLKNDSQSIQQLLIAEKRAEEKTNQSRKRKIIRLKQAKEEAQTEIQDFRAEKETAFKEYEAKFMGTREQNVLKIDLETTKSIKEMEQLVNFKKNQVIDYLLDQVFEINREVHENFRM